MKSSPKRIDQVTSRIFLTILVKNLCGFFVMMPRKWTHIALRYRRGNRVVCMLLIRFIARPVGLLSLVLAIGCSGQGIGVGGGGGGGGIGLSAGSTSQASLSSTAQAALSALNQSPTYQITSADLTALQNSGALTAAEIAQLRAELGL